MFDIDDGKRDDDDDDVDDDDCDMIVAFGVVVDVVCVSDGKKRRDQVNKGVSDDEEGDEEGDE